MDPRFLKAYLQLGAESDLYVQDASAFAAEDEELSFLQLQARAASVRQVRAGQHSRWHEARASWGMPATAAGPEGRSALLHA